KVNKIVFLLLPCETARPSMAGAAENKNATASSYLLADSCSHRGRWMQAAAIAEENREHRPPDSCVPACSRPVDPAHAGRRGRPEARLPAVPGASTIGVDTLTVVWHSIGLSEQGSRCSMTRPVTDKQRGVLAAGQKFWEVRGVAPSLADLAADLELSRATIHEHLQALKRKGQLEHIEGVGRSWRSTTAAPTSPSGPKRIPIVGAVAAGTPIFAQENINGWLTVDEAREQDTLFGLRIRGDSMTDAGILDGDIAIVR